MVQYYISLKTLASLKLWSALSALSLVLIGNVLIPKLIYEIWTRDCDVGLWFCAGCLLSELSIAGILCRWNLGKFEWRLLGSSCWILAVAISAWYSFEWCGPISRSDAIAFVSFVTVAPFVFGILDYVFLALSSTNIGRQNLLVSHSGFEDSQVQDSQSATEFRFGIPVLFGWITLVAMSCMLVRSALSHSETADRSVRIYFEYGFIRLAALALFFWLLHNALLFATLHKKIAPGIAIAAALGILGTELIRQIQQWWMRRDLDYLSWEFAIIVLGFVVSHVVIGSTVRWLDWGLCQSRIRMPSSLRYTRPSA